MLTGTIQQKLTMIDKMVAMQNLVKERIDEAKEQVSVLQPILKLVIQRTRELQSEVCKNLQFNNFMRN